MNRSCWITVLLAVTCATSRSNPAEAQKLWYEAATGDSMVSLGLEPVVAPDGDTVLVHVYRSFAALGDTVIPRRQALVSWAGLSAMVKTRGYRRAAILYLWPKEPTDSLFTKGVAARWIMNFAQDADGCWHIVNDTTPVSTCVLRDDPKGAGIEGHRP